MNKEHVTKGPVKACRSHEEFQGSMWDIEPDEQAEYDAKPFVHIENAAHEKVVSAHDLFTFKTANAELIAEAFNVLHETGYTPRELAEQVKELWASLSCLFNTTTYPRPTLKAVKVIAAEARAILYKHQQPDQPPDQPISEPNRYDKEKKPY